MLPVTVPIPLNFITFSLLVIQFFLGLEARYLRATIMWWEMGKKCRIWWPTQLSSSKSTFPSSAVLFGWFISSSSASLDVVVAFASDEVSLSQLQPGLQGILQYTNDKMPVLLQDRSMFSILGHCAANLSSNRQLQRVRLEEDEQTKHSVHDNMYHKETGNILRGNNSRWSCGCHKLDGISERFKRTSIENGTWIQLLFDSHQSFDRNICGIPKLHHIHWHGNVVFLRDVHVCKSWLQFTASSTL